MVYVYGDDGSDEKRERVNSVAVVHGSDEHWKELEEKWMARCNGIPFHAKDCESDQGDYRGISHDENKAMYRDLAILVAESRVRGVGIAIDLAAQKKVLPNSLPLAYYRAFAEAIARAAQVAENVSEVAKITFDISPENEYNAGLIYSGIRESERRFSEWLYPEISFISAKYSPRLQVADMLAYEAWKALDHTVGDIKRHRRSWKALRDNGKFETDSCSEDWFTDLKSHLQAGRVQAIAGFNEDDYKKWLTQRNRLHNISNLLAFINSVKNKEE